MWRGKCDSGFGPDAGEAISSHMKINKVAFTGSTKGLKLIMRLQVDQLSSVTLELGSKCPTSYLLSRFRIGRGKGAPCYIL